MTTFNVSKSQSLRKRLLASAAMLALIVAGAIGETVLTRGVAQAAAVNTSGLQSASPSFSDMIARVKPAVVSIRVTMKGGEGELGSAQHSARKPSSGDPPLLQSVRL